MQPSLFKSLLAKLFRPVRAKPPTYADVRRNAPALKVPLQPMIKPLKWIPRMKARICLNKVANKLIHYNGNFPFYNVKPRPRKFTGKVPEVFI